MNQLVFLIAPFKLLRGKLLVENEKKNANRKKLIWLIKLLLLFRQQITKNYIDAHVSFGKNK